MASALFCLWVKPLGRFFVSRPVLRQRLSSRQLSLQQLPLLWCMTAQLLSIPLIGLCRFSEEPEVLGWEEHVEVTIEALNGVHMGCLSSG